MKAAVKKVKIHPYISSTKGICGDRAVITGTRIPVWSIIRWYKLGMAIEEILREFPRLSPAQIHDAFSYYYDFQKEIEQDIEENNDEKSWKKFLKENAGA